MPKKIETTEEKLDHLIRLAQDLLILQALQAGVKSHEVASIVRIDKGRVSNISKCLKSAQ
jgi:predicted transcriptional regulator